MKLKTGWAVFLSVTAAYQNIPAHIALLGWRFQKNTHTQAIEAIFEDYSQQLRYFSRIIKKGETTRVIYVHAGFFFFFFPPPSFHRLIRFSSVTHWASNPTQSQPRQHILSISTETFHAKKRFDKIKPRRGLHTWPSSIYAYQGKGSPNLPPLPPSSTTREELTHRSALPKTRV